MLTTIVLAKILAPADYGKWMALLLIPSYGTIACFGTVETLLKQYPYYLGKGNKGEALRVEGDVLGAIIESGLVFLTLGLTLNFILDVRLLGSLGEYFVFMIMAAPLGFLTAFFLNRFAAHQDFRLFGLADSVRSILTFVLLMIMSWLLGIFGTVLGWVVVEIMMCLLLWFLSFRVLGYIKPSFGVKRFIALAKIGFPITMVWWFFMLQGTVDRVISISMLGEVSTGYYGLGLSLVSVLILIPLSLGQVLYPKINEVIGSNAKSETLNNLVLLPAQALSILVSWMAGLLIFVAPWIYLDLFPKYGPGLFSAQILIIGAFFACLTRNAINYLIATNRQNLLLWFSLVALVIKAAGNFIMVFFGTGIEGIGLSTLLSGAILTTLIWMYTFKGMGYNLSERWKASGILYMPFLVLILATSLIRLLFKSALTASGLMSIVFSIIFSIIFSISIIVIPSLRYRIAEIVLLVKNSVEGNPISKNIGTNDQV
jgi:O-antigen/teichoic acid export membrane protein